MINLIKRLFGTKQPIIKFTPHIGAPNVSKLTNIQLATEVIPKWLQEQKYYENSKDKFQNCPGMNDLMKAGYIIPAWDDIRIKSNRAGTIADMQLKYTEPLRPMNEKIVAGIAPLDKDMPLQVYKLNTPWSVTTAKGYSAIVAPALYHSPFLKDIYVYGGINDYEEFHTLNFIFSPLRDCDVVIPAGTPLLHIIPYKNEPISGVVEPSTKEGIELYKFFFPTRVRGAYRKFFHKRKTYTLETKQ